MFEAIRDRQSVERSIQETSSALAWALLTNDRTVADIEKRALDGYRRLDHWLSRSPLSPAEVLKATAERCRVTVADILSKDTSRQVRKARKEVAQILSVNNLMSTPEIARVMKQSHRTIQRYLTGAP